MILIYTAGPYGNKTRVNGIGDGFVDGVTENIERAGKVAAQLWDMGYAVICPHLNTREFEKLCTMTTHEDFLRGDIAIISRCDAVVMLPGWEDSQGARLERNVAQGLGIPVYYWDVDQDILSAGI